MALTTDLFSEQRAARAQCEQSLAELEAPAYAQHKQTLIDKGDLAFDHWKLGVRGAIANFDEAIAGRTISEGAQQSEARSLDAGQILGQRWVDEGRTILRRAARNNLPGAVLASDTLETMSLPTDSLRDLRGSIHTAISWLQPQAGRQSWGFPADFIERGSKIAEMLLGDTVDQVQAQAGITVHAKWVHQAMVAMAELMEDLYDAHELVYLRTGDRLPGFDLRIIRAAGASSKAAIQPVAVDTGL